MDEVTQQNSALVEENASTAKTLEDQQTAMAERVGYFRYEAEARAAAAASKPVAVRNRAA
jgi:methyl-accepting chemotaxis protein